MKVYHPVVIRERIRAIMQEPASVPERHRETIAERILDGVGTLFPTYQGKVVSSSGVPESRARVRWNAERLLAYLFADEGSPFAPVPFRALTDGQWRSLGRWAGLLEGMPKRAGFPLECVWLANRGLWLMAYNERFHQKPPLSRLLAEMARVYDEAQQGSPLDLEPGGVVAAAMRARGEPIEITKENMVELLGRWRAAAGDAKAIAALARRAGVIS